MRLASRLLAALTPRSEEEMEAAYLNDACSCIDLEVRQRAVDRGAFRRAGRTYGRIGER